MGLDIVSHRKVQLVGASREYAEAEDLICVTLFRCFSHAIPGVPIIEEFIDRTGTGFALMRALEPGGEHARTSYSGYSMFRDLLTGLVPPARLELQPGDSFYEMVFMSDCEGFFTAPVCKKIAKDFDDYREAFAEKYSDDWMRLYNEWGAVFRDAADRDGIVEYR